jgi:uncharacterized protein (DUF2237 family)
MCSFPVLLLALIMSKQVGAALSVLGSPLRPCCFAPVTGYYRDGFCSLDASDRGSHTVCAIVTREFLNFTASRGNDLATPRPPHFPGLQPGDKWCLCASRWLEAYDAFTSGAVQRAAVPAVVLSATNEAALRICPVEALRAHAAVEEAAISAT